MTSKFALVHGIKSCLTSILGVVGFAVFIDFFVCFAVRDLKLYDEDKEEDHNNGFVASANNKELQPILSPRVPPDGEEYIKTLGA